MLNAKIIKNNFDVNKSTNFKKEIYDEKQQYVSDVISNHPTSVSTMIKDPNSDNLTFDLDSISIHKLIN